MLDRLKKEGLEELGTLFHVQARTTRVTMAVSGKKRDVGAELRRREGCGTEQSASILEPRCAYGFVTPGRSTVKLGECRHG